MKEEKENKQLGELNFFKFGRMETGTPIVKEHFGRNKWIEYGANNDYPQELIRLYQNSSGLFKALCDRKAAMIAGSGFNPVAALEGMMANELSKDTLDEIALKCAYDIVIFGGYYLKLLYNLEGKVVQIDHLGLEKVRIEKPYIDETIEDDDLDVKGYYVSADWLQYKKTEYKPVYLPTYNPERFEEYPEQLLYTKLYCVGMDYYTLPTYSPALNYIKLDYEISTFHLKNVQNGLMPAMIIVNKQGIPPAHMREAEYQELKKRYAGADAAGDFIMVYAESPEKAPEFIPLELNTSDERFIQLEEQISSNIMRAMQFTSAVAGIEVAGKLGSKNEIEEQLEMLRVTVIKPLQKIINDSFNKLARVNDLPEEFELLEYQMFTTEQIKETTPIDVDALISILTNVKNGLMTRESALAALELLYGYDTENANKLLGPIVIVPIEDNTEETTI